MTNPAEGLAKALRRMLDVYVDRDCVIAGSNGDAAVLMADAALAAHEQSRAPACENCGSTECVSHQGIGWLCVEPGPCLARCRAKIDAAKQATATARRREAPTAPGFYPWRTQEPNSAVSIVVLDDDGTISCHGNEQEYEPRDMGGEWGPRIDMGGTAPSPAAHVADPPRVGIDGCPSCFGEPGGPHVDRCPEAQHPFPAAQVAEAARIVAIAVRDSPGVWPKVYQDLVVAVDALIASTPGKET